MLLRSEVGIDSASEGKGEFRQGWIRKSNGLNGEIILVSISKSGFSKRLMTAGFNSKKIYWIKKVEEKEVKPVLENSWFATCGRWIADAKLIDKYQEHFSDFAKVGIGIGKS